MKFPTYPIPAVAAVIEEQGQVLLVKRGVEPSKGRWSLPGGKIELGEPFKVALQREIREELQVEIEVQNLYAVKEYIEHDEDGAIKWHYIILDFRCKLLSGPPTASSDALEVTWVRPEDLIEMRLTRTTRELLKDKFPS
ncbi:MAG: NUDIX hydrolase [Candidatus Korarchaeota archaeon]|nr:NUDIX hydrolase [Candidatus Korarchaeota archaeon]NIU84862.1 NUDIX domain-containing protein [Candidatus Thorarchaeota archaeon]NIW14899.1 NUDIX domain-containing protein [Candidatus Thorarchaeota archaeon]NIW52536.1 NUDIX domain-containing protein [Candidatus Korarchaeota archaeon]